ncbi:hypothetical protein Pcaca04_30700 [Pectobacterium carotovorum subsp. carotovorum]|nr:hypothetical protein Pcaca04_30700 [Pectobacterium carotovorum subsp. carotovorum]
MLHSTWHSVSKEGDIADYLRLTISLDKSNKEKSKLNNTHTQQLSTLGKQYRLDINLATDTL